jgi:hypothetical protein
MPQTSPIRITTDDFMLKTDAPKIAKLFDAADAQLVDLGFARLLVCAFAIE